MNPVLRTLALGFLLAACVPTSSQPYADRADALLSAYHEASLFEGTALVAVGDSVVFEGSRGVADRSWSIPITPEARFRIGSVTKPFTAALVLLLVESGDVELDAPLATYIPGYPAPAGEHVTVHHLLAHTSGIPNFTGLPGFDAFERQTHGTEDLLAFFSGLDLEFEPGSAFRYSNSNYAVLGAIVEAVTGMTYADALQDRLLHPLGLKDTGYDGGVEVVARKARGYFRQGAAFVPEPYVDPSVPSAAGMLYSTAPDLARWTRALFGGNVFAQSATLRQMTRAQSGSATSGYGYGLDLAFRVVDGDTLRQIGHGGRIGAFQSEHRYLPDQDWTVITLSNSRGDTNALANDLVRLLLGAAPELPDRPVGWALAARIETDGLDAAARWYQALLADPDGYDVSEDQLNALGYVYLGRGEAETALRVFALNAEAYPGAWNVHDSLGEALAAVGRRIEAIAAYERSVALNPDNENGRVMLERLRADRP
ncbi:MAG: serine hydrolase [Bacteroidota bacterium]